MARIAGVDIPREKRVVISLTYVYGIGLKTSQKILKEAGVSEDVRVKDLTEDQLDKIREIVDNYKTEGDLRREVSLNIKRLMEIGCYRGIRVELLQYRCFLLLLLVMMRLTFFSMNYLM